MQQMAQRLGFVIIPVLLFAYCAPILAVSVASFIGELNGHTTFGRWFVALVAQPESALNLFHKILIPVTAGVTVATMWNAGNAPWTAALVIGLVISLVLAIYLTVLFGVADVQGDMWQPAGNTKVTSGDQFYTLATSYTGRVQETLATYLLILLGLQTIPKTQSQPRTGTQIPQTQTQQ